MKYQLTTILWQVENQTKWTIWMTGKVDIQTRFQHVVWNKHCSSTVFVKQNTYRKTKQYIQIYTYVKCNSLLKLSLPPPHPLIIIIMKEVYTLNKMCRLNKREVRGWGGVGGRNREWQKEKQRQHVISLPFSHCFGYLMYDTDLFTRDQTVIRSLKQNKGPKSSVEI